MNNPPQRIYLEVTQSGNGTVTRSTVDEGTFNNWRVFSQLTKGMPGEKFRKYYVGTVDWEEVTGDD